MNTEIISADLAVVGRTSRARLVDLESTLGRIAVPRPVGGLRELLSISPVYASRIARIASGAYALAAVVCVLVLHRLTHQPVDDSWADRPLFMPLLQPPSALASTIAISGVLVYVATRALAIRRCDRLLRESIDPLTAGARLVEGTRLWALVLAVLAALALTYLVV